MESVEFCTTAVTRRGHDSVSCGSTRLTGEAGILAERFQGEALTERTTNYDVVAKGGTIDPPQ
ncbi:hypothetical protein, partial [Rathayibacter sp. AY2B7]|uniref:hypothetical protein n=1 Tax=Rathayibacter sp. AY2B7 TaxID=2080571 RepID=UPI001CA51F53